APTFKPGSIDPTGSVQTLVVQPDGKILVGGSFATINGVARNRVARLNADGTLDTTFDPGAGANSTVNAITVLDDGRLLIGGSFSSVDNVSRNGVARLSTTGALDRSFGSATANAATTINALTLQPDGKILQRGNFVSVSIAPVVPGTTNTTTSSFGLVRLAADGVPDSSVTISGFAGLTQDSSVILDDGRILVAHATPSLALNGDVRTGLTLLVPQTGIGFGSVLRPTYVVAGQNVTSGTVFPGNTTGPVTYQWRKGGTPLAPVADRIAGTNSRTLAFTNTQVSDAGTYDCVVTDGAGSATTNSFVLTVAAAAPTVSLPAASATAASSSTASPTLTYREGTSLALFASASGSGPLSYQWQRGGVDIPGATASALDLGALTAANVGVYTVKVSNSIAPAGVVSAGLT
ncbi:MAG: hypothetical protein CFE32_19125, partial [Alphaproteobacteria bacterium PA3]